jgi:hypothetical protein
MTTIAEIKAAMAVVKWLLAINLALTLLLVWRVFL